MNLPLNTRDTILAAGLALCAAVVMGVTVASLSTPKAFEPRTSKLEQGTDEVRGLLRMRAASGLETGVICAGDPAAAARRLREAIGQDAGLLRLTLTSLDVSVEGAEGAGLSTLRIRLDASGGYDAALGLLERIDGHNPQVFADTVDLVSKTSSVTIRFSGRAFCSV